MIDNQINLLILICFMSFSSVFCKNTQPSPDNLQLNDLSWNNGLMFNTRFMLPEHQQQLKNRYNFLNQQLLNKDELNEGRKNLFDARFSNVANEDKDYRSKMRDINLELVELNNERNADGKLRNINNLLNRPLRDELINRQTRSDQLLNQQRISSKLIDMLNQDLLRAFSQDPAALQLTDEELYLLNDKLQKKQTKDEIELNESKQNKNSKELKDDKSTKQLITNNSNYSPVVDTNQQQNTIPKNPNNRPFRKAKLNRVSKSANKFLGNNVSDCIKDCVSQGILHPVQCHSLC